MKTKSLTSSIDSAFGASGVPGAGSVAFDGTATRIGPYDPMCSHIVAVPGPPFQKNVTGRVRGSAPSAVYETAKTRAISSPSALRSTLVPARAVYATAFPPSVIEWCVTAGAGSAATAGRTAEPKHTSSAAAATAANLRIFTEKLFGAG
jgi:hypothetical protein